MSDSGHPSRFGFRQCRWCKCQRPLPLLRFIDDGYECLEWVWCETTTGTRRSAAQVKSEGWDANGSPAPTGIDENGDAA